MKRTLSSGFLILAVVVGSGALAGCMSKDPDPPKVEAATATNTQGKKPVGVSAAGGKGVGVAGGSAPMGAQ
jgi:hypothetical protein